MKIGMIVAQGQGQGHRARCDALRSGLLAAGHEIAGCFAPALDWLVVDDPHYRDSFANAKVLCVRDDAYCEHHADLTIRPYAQPELAWVGRDNLSYRQICFGMSQQGQALKDQLYMMRNNYCYDSKWTLGAPGHSSWERCVAGIPTLQIIFSESQRAVGKAIEDAGAGATVWNVLDEGEVQVGELRERIRQWLEPELLQAMSDAARKLCDGKGVERTIKLMEDMV